MDGCFVHSPVFDTAVLLGLFQANVIARRLKERMISPERVDRMREWRYSGEEWVSSGHRDYDTEAAAVGNATAHALSFRPGMKSPLDSHMSDRQ